MKNEELEIIRIEELTEKGDGLGFFRKDGLQIKSKVVVAHCLPGDLIEVCLYKKRKGVIKGRAQ